MKRYQDYQFSKYLARAKAEPRSKVIGEIIGYIPITEKKYEILFAAAPMWAK